MFKLTSHILLTSAQSHFYKDYLCFVDDGVVGISVVVIGVLLTVLLVDSVGVGPVVVVSGTVDDVG